VKKEANVKTDALTHAQSARFRNAHSQPLAHIFNDNINMSARTSLQPILIICISEWSGYSM